MSTSRTSSSEEEIARQVGVLAVELQRAIGGYRVVLAVQTHEQLFPDENDGFFVIHASLLGTKGKGVIATATSDTMVADCESAEFRTQLAEQLRRLSDLLLASLKR